MSFGPKGGKWVHFPGYVVSLFFKKFLGDPLVLDIAARSSGQGRYDSGLSAHRRIGSRRRIDRRAGSSDHRWWPSLRPAEGGHLHYSFPVFLLFVWLRGSAQI